jgi:hypothetical protein
MPRFDITLYPHPGTIDLHTQTPAEPLTLEPANAADRMDDRAAAITRAQAALRGTAPGTRAVVTQRGKKGVVFEAVRTADGLTVVTDAVTPDRHHTEG